MEDKIRDNNALMIVDVQVGMFDESNPVANGDELLIILGRLIAQAREAGMPIVYIQHDGQEDELLEPGKPGWPIHPDIAPGEEDSVVRKRHPDSFQGTNLQEVLEQRDISNIVLAGIQTEYCVDTTCRRAYSLGYEVMLVQDGHSTWDSGSLTASEIVGHHNALLADWFVSLANADEIRF